MTDTLISILLVFNLVCLVAVVVLNYNGLVRLAFSLLRLANYAEALHNSPHERLVDNDSLMPATLILPDCDEEVNAVRTVRKLLEIDYPEYEIVAVCDSRRSRTLNALVQAYNMVEVRQPIRRVLETEQVSRVYRSSEHPELIVVDKPSAGRHDALNTGVNISRYPLFVVLAQGVTLKKDGLVDITMPFAKSHRVVAVGGLPRVDGRSGMARGLLPSFQQAEYLSTFPAGLAVPGQTKLPIMPGAFGAFRKQTVISRGGFVKNSSETELVVRLHRSLIDRNVSHEVELLAEPVFRINPPKNLVRLFKQRRRWQRELMSTLWMNRGMILNPHYGRTALDMFFTMLFEIFLPVLELGACIAIPLSFAFGLANSALFITFLAAEILFSIVISLAGVISQQILESDTPSFGRLLNLLFFSILTSFGYRQIVLLFKVISLFMPYPKLKKRKSDAKVTPEYHPPAESLTLQDALTQSPLFQGVISYDDDTTSEITVSDTPVKAPAITTSHDSKLSTQTIAQPPKATSASLQEELFKSATTPQAPKAPSASLQEELFKSATAPQAPKAPSASLQEELFKKPQAPQAPKAPSASLQEELFKKPQAPQPPKAPSASLQEELFKSATAPQAPKAPSASLQEELFKSATTPQAPKAPSASLQEELFKKPQAPQAPKAPSASLQEELFKSATAPQAPKAPSASLQEELFKKPQAPQPPKASSATPQSSPTPPADFGGRPPIKKTVYRKKN